MIKLMNCPLCTRGELEHKEARTSLIEGFNFFQDGDRPTHAYICDECPFIGFEYHNPNDIEALKRIIK
jgi:hypothetical protein